MGWKKPETPCGHAVLDSGSSPSATKQTPLSDTSQEERILPLLSAEDVESHHFTIASSTLHMMQCATIVPITETLNVCVDRRKSVRSASTTQGRRCIPGRYPEGRRPI